MGSSEASVRSQDADARTYGGNFNRGNVNVDTTEVATRLYKATVRGCKADGQDPQIDGYPHNVEGRFSRGDVERYGNNMRLKDEGALFTGSHKTSMSS